jgi:hypothetical protein
MLGLRLLKRKEIWVPTAAGWVLMLGVLALVLVTGLVTVVPFLAPVHPISGGILVVEGWLPDSALEEAKKVFESHPYQCLVVTGVPIDQGLFITKATNYAQLAAITLRGLGVKPEAVVPVSSPEVPRDRTYSTARQVRDWLDREGKTDTLDVLTIGVHARRTWLLYQSALGKRYRVGIIAAKDDRYDPKVWWTTSSGFRTVTSEALAYFYAKVFFYPRRGIPGDGGRSKRVSLNSLQALTR